MHKNLISVRLFDEKKDADAYIQSDKLRTSQRMTAYYGEPIVVPYSIDEAIQKQMTREAFMNFWRSDDMATELSVDDRIEIFRDALVGSSDFTQELFEQLANDYSMDIYEVLGVQKPHAIHAAADTEQVTCAHCGRFEFLTDITTEEADAIKTALQDCSSDDCPGPIAITLGYGDGKGSIQVACTLRNVLELPAIKFAVLVNAVREQFEKCNLQIPYAYAREDAPSKVDIDA